MTPPSIAAINKLPRAERSAIYRRFIPCALIRRFGLGPALTDPEGTPLLQLRAEPGSTDVVLELRHAPGAPDPILYAHLTDTTNGQIHVLLYILNDPASPRYDVDRMPDGAPTQFGLLRRNLAAEVAALQAGLAPGQVRRGLGLLRDSLEAFEAFVASLGHDLYFVDPLYYHNAITFERYGFAYQTGRRRMRAIHAGFQPGGELEARLNGSSPFRQPEAANSIRGRSWAVHDGILGEPYTGVTMYKRLGHHAGEETFPNAIW